MKNLFLILLMSLTSNWAVFAADLSIFKEGEIVTIVGIKNKPELNGRYGTVGRFNEKKGRYSVTLVRNIIDDVMNSGHESKTEAYFIQPKNLQSTEYIRIQNTRNSRSRNQELVSGRIFKVNNLVPTTGTVEILDSVFLFAHDRGTFWDFSLSFAQARASIFKKEIDNIPANDYEERLWALRGIVLSNAEAQKIAKEIGEAIYAEGGHEYMLQMHARMSARVHSQDQSEQPFIRSFPRELEYAWDGVGDWRG